MKRTTPPDPELFPSEAPHPAPAPERERAVIQKEPHPTPDSGFEPESGTDADLEDPQLAARLDELFGRLSHSAFRSRFHLRRAELAYVGEKGLATLRLHAAEFVRTRLAPACPPNNGRQTPMRGHPVFLAQHATGCCCRGCLAKWHGIPAGRPLTPEEQTYVVAVLMAWIRRQLGR